MNIRAITGRLRASFRQALRPDANSMVLRQTHVWSRAILWMIVGTFVAVVLWACLAPMDQVVHATGKLEPRGSVRELQSPVNGVIEEALVREGDQVKAGQLLVRIKPKSVVAEVRSLQQRLDSLLKEQSFYNSILSGNGGTGAPDGVPAEIEDLAKNRAGLQHENELFGNLRDGIGEIHAAIKTSLQPGASPVPDPVEEQLEKLDKLPVDVDASPDLRKLLHNEITNLSENYLRLRTQLLESRKIAENRKLSFEAYSRLNESGNLSRVDFLAQEAAYFDSVAKVENLEDQIKNLPTTFRAELNNRIRENTNRINDLESNLSKYRRDNSKEIAQIESQLTSAQEQMSYHDICSPSDGIVFETKVKNPLDVVFAKDVVLSIIPSGELIAKVDVTNRDIGFIAKGMPCEVEVDTFPKREFGHIDGEVYFIGSSSVPPTEVKNFTSFTVKVSLSKQMLAIRGKDIPLQSGMSVGVNIKTRKRLVVNLFLDTLLGPVEKMREVR